MRLGEQGLMLTRDKASEAYFIARSRYMRAKRDLLLARCYSERGEIYCSLAVRASEARFIACSLLERAKRDLLLARC